MKDRMLDSEHVPKGQDKGTGAMESSWTQVGRRIQLNYNGFV